MHVHLTVWHDSATCVWCEKAKECVTVSFQDGFMKDTPLCWKCFAKAVKVRSQQEAKLPIPKSAATTS